MDRTLGDTVNVGSYVGLLLDGRPIHVGNCTDDEFGCRKCNLALGSLVQDERDRLLAQNTLGAESSLFTTTCDACEKKTDYADISYHRCPLEGGHLLEQLCDDCNRACGCNELDDDDPGEYDECTCDECLGSGGYDDEVQEEKLIPLLAPKISITVKPASLRNEDLVSRLLYTHEVVNFGGVYQPSPAREFTLASHDDAEVRWLIAVWGSRRLGYATEASDTDLFISRPGLTLARAWSLAERASRSSFIPLRPAGKIWPLLRLAERVTLVIVPWYSFKQDEEAYRHAETLPDDRRSKAPDESKEEYWARVGVRFRPHHHEDARRYEPGFDLISTLKRLGV